MGVGRHCLIALDPMKIGGRRGSRLKEREENDGGGGRRESFMVVGWW